ncbi:hypothetical protein E2C01_056642 [Portunus trituberculatus]|uniref:Uncharacterized protein n=1 Tax=Portunus trituberculatus TaxID=210409 RepID=A0A5B7H147_PORTR|nr:hypothetical protein [Portunus trituberculatus]
MEQARRAKCIERHAVGLYRKTLSDMKSLPAQVIAHRKGFMSPAVSTSVPRHDTPSRGAGLRSAAPPSLRRVAADQFPRPTLWPAQYKCGWPGRCSLPGPGKAAEGARAAGLRPTAMPVRAGWVPCVGIQPPKPMVVMIEEADAIAEECERAYNTPTNAPTTPFFSPRESLPLHHKFMSCSCSP